MYRTIRLSKGDDRALPGLWGDEAEETGHSEESGVEGEVEWSERGGLGVGVVWGRGGKWGFSWVRGASTGAQATTSTVSPPMRQTRPRRNIVIFLFQYFHMYFYIVYRDQGGPSRLHSSFLLLLGPAGANQPHCQRPGHRGLEFLAR